MWDMRANRFVFKKLLLCGTCGAAGALYVGGGKWMGYEKN